MTKTTDIASQQAGKAIAILEGIMFESGLYSRYPHCEADERYCRKVHDLAANAIALLKGEPLPYPKGEIQP